MRNISILVRLSLSFAFILLVSIGVTGFLIATNTHNHLVTRELDSEILPDTIQLMELEKRILYVENLLTDAAIETGLGDNTADLSSAGQAYNEADASLADIIAKHSQRGETDVVSELQKISGSLEAFYQTGLDIIHGGSIDDRRQRMVEFHDKAEEFVGRIDQLVQEHQNELTGSVADLDKRLTHMNRAAVAGSALALIFALVVVLRIIRSIRIPVHELKRAAGSLAEGDLTDPPQYVNGNELGQVCDSLRRALKAMERLIFGIRYLVVDLTEKKNELAANTEETSAAVTEISGTIGSMSQHIGMLDENIETSAASVVQISGVIRQFDGMIESLAAVVEESSAAVNQTIAQIRSVSDIAEKRVTSSRDMGRALETGGEKIEATDAVVRQVADSVSEIQKMLELINRISAQTNLLSMNAAIEAAHAGDAGRGFSVVATEIRNLAEESGRNSKNISLALKEIIQRIHEASQSSDESKQTFTALRQTAGEVVDSFSEIAAAMSEMSSGSEQVLSALGRLNELSGSVRSRSSEIEESTRVVSEAMEKLQNISSQARGGMEEMKVSVDEITLAMGEVASLTEAVDSATEQVGTELGKFTTGETA